MIFPILLSFAFIFMVYGDEPTEEGKCADIKPVELTIGNVDKWYVLYTNDVDKVGDSCITCSTRIKEDANKTIIFSFQWENPKGVRKGVQYKVEIVPGKSGAFKVFQNGTDGTWIDEATYTTIDKAESGDSVTVLQQICKNVGNGKHYQYFQIPSTKTSMSDTDYQRMVEVAKKYGNTNKFVKVDHDGCTPELS